MFQKYIREIKDIFYKKFKFLNNEVIELHNPHLDKTNIKYLKLCVDKLQISSQGSYIEKFSKLLKQFTKSKYVVLTNSGTSALHISCIIAGIKHGDEVLIPSYTFAATANAVCYCGAIPHFVDSDYFNLGIDTKKLEEYLEKITLVKNNICYNKKTGRVISAIIPVHIFGIICNIEKIIKISKKYKLKVIEDAAEALGSFKNSIHAGTFASIGIISFNGNKIISTGSGGAILLKNLSDAKKARHLISTAKRNVSGHYYHDQQGFNYRMPNINASLGYAQIIKIKKIISDKKKVFYRYKKILKNSKNLSLLDHEKYNTNFWLNAVKLNYNYPGLNEKIVKYFAKKKIFLRPGWSLLHEFPHFKKNPRMKISLGKIIKEKYINLPSGPDLIKKFK